MTANLINTSARINADVAGQTRAGEDVAPVTSTVGLTAHEVSQNLPGTGELDSILAGGVHPEAVPAVVDTSLQKATDAVAGPLGGLKSRLTSVTSPGPGGATNAAAAVQRGTAAGSKAISDARSNLSNFVAKYRKK